MMAVLFLIYFISQVIILLKKQNAAFALMCLNLAFCFLMLLHHSTDILKIRL